MTIHANRAPCAWAKVNRLTHEDLEARIMYISCVFLACAQLAHVCKPFEVLRGPMHARELNQSQRHVQASALHIPVLRVHAIARSA